MRNADEVSDKDSTTSSAPTKEEEQAFTTPTTQPIVKEEKKSSLVLKRNTSGPVSTFLCRLWFFSGLLLTWPPFCLIMAPFYFLHKWFGFDPNSTFLGQLFRWSNRLVIQSNPFWKIRTDYLVDKEKLPKSQKKCVFICNHQSNMDPFVLVSGPLPIEVKWVAKSELFSLPFGGWMMKMAGDVPIRFKSKKLDDMSTEKESVKRGMDRLKKYLTDDASIFFFPEGRRNNDPDTLLEFKRGAFVLALETQADIVPMAMYGSYFMWPTGASLPCPGGCQVVFGEPISVQGMTLEKDLEKLTLLAREKVEELYHVAREKYYNWK
ncbi:hypothetical protein ABK040_007924 [Willaertia magna]